VAEFTLKIEGMHCDSCIRRVSQALAAVPGLVVSDVGIGAAKLTSKAGAPDAAALAIAAVTKAGYAANLES